MGALAERLSQEVQRTLRVPRWAPSIWTITDKPLPAPILSVDADEPYADLMPAVQYIMAIYTGDNAFIMDVRRREKNQTEALFDSPDKEERRRMTVALARFIVAARPEPNLSRSEVFRFALAPVLDYSADELLLILAALEILAGPMAISGVEMMNGLRQVRAFAEKQPVLTPELIEQLRDMILCRYLDDKHRRAIVKIVAAATNSPAEEAKRLARYERTLTDYVGYYSLWGTRFREELAAMDDAEHEVWVNLVNVAATVPKATAVSRKWMKQTVAAVDAVGGPAVLTARLKAWFISFRVTHQMTTFGITIRSGSEYDRETMLYKGLIHMATPGADRELAALYADLAVHCFDNALDDGYLMKVGGACLMGLAAMPDGIGIPHLGRLKTSVRHKGALKTLNNALGAAAEAIGLTRDQLEESQVPTGDMDRIGEGRRTFGDATLVYTIRDSSHLELRWENSKGKPVKSAPASAKADPEWKAFQRELKELAKTLSSQRVRLDGLMRRLVDWRFDWWRKHYIDHPMVGWLARRLLWVIADGTAKHLGMWEDDRLVDVAGEPLPAFADDATVALFHPVDFDEDIVLAWRDRLLAREVVQPFKQVFREVYTLTPAEEITRTYSNRFANHALSHNRLLALAKERGWSMIPFGSWDTAGEDPLRLSLPDWKIVAEFTVNETYDDRHPESGFATGVASDSVAFVGPKGRMDLADVPRRVFTEVMRDVDLFVAVANTGIDAENGSGEQTALKARRALLEKLLPRLRIAPQCRLDGRYLVVNGSLRTYRIHLASANILMEPNDRYLCIVPDRKGRESYYLPFEGDTVLATVLSKAFLLVDDAKIKDDSIMRQIRG